MENKELYLILLANPENEMEKMGFGNMKGHVVEGTSSDAYIKANELTNGDSMDSKDEEEIKEFLGTTSVIKLKSLTPISSGPIEGSDLYDLVEECEDPKNAISSLLNTLG